VKQLRDKLAGADAKIETVWGVGYRLARPTEQAKLAQEDE
jgi:DNA-binding response OmpR family regulator